MKLDTLLQQAKRELKAISYKAYQEALWILSDSLKLPISQIYLKNNVITKKQEKDFWLKVDFRKQGMPLEYILREKFFLNYKFYVEDSVFIPRPETEVLVKWLFENIPKNKAFKFIDFGTGAGTIILSILDHFVNSLGVAVELQSKSIKCIKKNSQNLKLQNRLYILKKDVCKIENKDLCQFYLDTLGNNLSYKKINCYNENKLYKNSFLKKANSSSKKLNSFLFESSPDLITANPPYIDPEDKNIQKEVYLYESPLALFSDKKGLGHIICWFEKAINLLKPNGIYIFEFGWKQKEQITNFLDRQKTISSYQILTDQSGHPRIAVCFKKG
ncbi:MAG: peptide chain release factor N(5)-glutamine methyltransferase [Bdellovibrionaceae bacterium]|nr:peptide chain release factor N(5)-glutamine methyltransferase [Pseudobdellovibrionaceae bacterium]